MIKFIYFVYCGENTEEANNREPATFDTEVEAMEYAREENNKYDSVRVEKTEVDDETGENLNSEVIWEAGKVEPKEEIENLVNENEFATDFEDAELSTEIDDPDYEEMAKQYENPNLKEAVDALEENESEVECKCCFDLFPKEDCVKTEKGYVCPKCHQEMESHQGTNLDLIDKDPFDLDYDDPRLPEEEEEPEVKEEPLDANEVRKHEAGIEEKLEEHINDRPADIESDQKLLGTDNAVVDCEVAKVIAHSEDEKPLDCKMEKPALEEPLAGEKVDIKINEDLELTEAEIKELDEELKDLELEEAKKAEDELPPDPEVVKLEVHQELNDLVADEIEAINGYEEVKADIIDKPVEHKDEIINTINHIEDEEKEHIDELVDVTTEIPFDGEHKEEAPVVEEPVVEDPLDQDFPEVEEKLEEKAMVDIPFDSDVKEGDKIRIIHLDGEGTDYDGKEGTVNHIDSIGQLHGTWGGLAVIPGVDEFEIITEGLKEEKIEEAKPAGDKVKSYNDGLKLAKVYNKPVIYGYTNKALEGKFFALEDPIICEKEPRECEKEFRNQYKTCGTVYVAYPDKDFVESIEEHDALKEYWWEDNDPMNQVDNEDEVECGWCGEKFPESDCRYEKDFGHLCPQCEAELKSRGEELVFIEPAPQQEGLKEAVNPDIQEQINNILDARMDDWRGLAMEDEDEDEDSDPDAYAEDRMSDYANDVEAFIDDYDVLGQVGCTKQEAIKAIENWLIKNNYK